MQGIPCITAWRNLHHFEDLTYAPAVTWANAKHVVGGYGGIFGIGNNVTREDACVMLWRAGDGENYHRIDGEFNDVVDIDDYAMYAMLWCIHEHIISGDDNHNLNPRNTATRAEIAKIMSVYYEDIFLKKDEVPSEETTVPTDAPTQGPEEPSEPEDTTEAPTESPTEEPTEEPTEHEHTLVHVPAKEPTFEEDGNIEYWYCTECGQYFADANGTKLIDKYSVIRPKFTYDKTAKGPNGETLVYVPEQQIGITVVNGIEHGVPGYRDYWLDPVSGQKYFASNEYGLSFTDDALIDEADRWVKATDKDLCVPAPQEPDIVKNADGSTTYTFHPVEAGSYNIFNCCDNFGGLQLFNPTNWEPSYFDDDMNFFVDWDHGHLVDCIIGCGTKYADGATIAVEEYKDYYVTYVNYKGTVTTYTDPIPEYREDTVDEAWANHHSNIEQAKNDGVNHHGYIDAGCLYVLDKELVITQYPDGSYKIIK